MVFFSFSQLKIFLARSIAFYKSSMQHDFTNSSYIFIFFVVLSLIVIFQYA